MNKNNIKNNVKSNTTSHLLDKYLLYLERTESPRIFHKWCFYSTIASVLQRKVWVQWGDAEIFANLYVVLVGAPSLGKSQAIKECTKFIDDIPSIHQAPTRTTAEALVVELRKAQSQLSSSFLEITENTAHWSLSVISSEFASFVGDKKNNGNKLTLLTDIFDCGKIVDVVKTDTAKNSSIPRSYVNLLAGTTEGSIADCIPVTSIGSGFISRILFVWDSKKHRKIPFPEYPKTGKLHEEIQEALEEIHVIQGGYGFTEEATEFWTAWYLRQEEEKKICGHPAFEYWYGRKPLFVLKLSLIIKVSELPITDIQLIGKEHIQQAIRDIEEVELDMSNAFTSLSRNIYSLDLSLIENAVKREKSLTKSNLLRLIRHQISDPLILDNLILHLTSAGVLRKENSPSFVNPTLYFIDPE